jgi:hypothetical protein
MDDWQLLEIELLRSRVESAKSHDSDTVVQILWDSLVSVGRTPVAAVQPVSAKDTGEAEL